jgi:hypothetical protein
LVVLVKFKVLTASRMLSTPSELVNIEIFGASKDMATFDWAAKFKMWVGFTLLMISLTTGSSTMSP